MPEKEPRIRESKIPLLYGRIRKPLQQGAFTLDLTPEQQEQVAKLCADSATDIRGLEVQLVEGKIASAAVIVGTV